VKRYCQLTEEEWKAKLAAAEALATPCQLCPRRCRVDRTQGGGFCHQTSLALAHWQLHYGEEPCLVGTPPDGGHGPRPYGSATFFFVGCNLGCVYCQNYKISWGKAAPMQQLTPAALAALFLAAQAQGAANLNLVTPTIYLDQILQALYLAVGQGLKLPLVYNTSSYESLAALAILENVVDIYLADLKYDDAHVAALYSQAADYPQVAQAALLAMQRQVGGRILRRGLLHRGLIIRHLVLPGQAVAAVRLAAWIKEHCPQAYFSLLAQYDPPAILTGAKFKELQRPLTPEEYQQACRGTATKATFYQELAAAQVWRPQFTGNGGDQFRH